MSFDKAMLEKATTSTDEATPAWMFHQMAKWTRDYSSCQKMEDFLFKKLSSGKPHSVKKALIVIKQVAAQGDTQFAVNLAKKTEEIKKYTTYKGPIDPQYGDALNTMIRQAASEAIQAIFARTETRNAPPSFDNGGQDPRIGSGNMGIIQKDPEAQQYNNMIGVGSGSGPSMSGNSFAGIGSGGYTPAVSSGSSGFGGFGSGGFGSSGSGSPYGNGNNIGSMGGSGRMVGIGSPSAMANMQAQQASNDGVLAKAVNFASNLLQREKYSGFDPSQHMNFINQDTSSTYQPPSDSAAQKPMGGFFSQNDASARDDFDVKQQSAASNTGLHEQKIVDDFCQVSAVQAIPSRAEISQFCTRCATVNSELIAQKLYEKLAPVNNWQLKLKALVAIEALVKAKNNIVFSFFVTNFDLVQACTIAQQDKLSQRATKVMNLLQNKPDVDAPRVKKTPQQLPQGAYMNNAPLRKDNLLDMGGDDAPADESMFENMSTSTNVAAPVSSAVPVQAVNKADPFSNSHPQDELSELISGPSTGNANGQNKERNRANSSSAIMDFFQPTPVASKLPGNVVTVPVYIPVAVPMNQMQPMQPMQPLQPMRATPVVAPKTSTPSSGAPSGFDFMKNQPVVDPFDFARDEMKKK